jgi:hypothetical protein
MMRTLCFSFLVLASSQMVMSSDNSKSDGNLFGSWRAGNEIDSPLILDCAPFKQCTCVVSGLSAGAMLAMNGCTLSPLCFFSLISLMVGRHMIIERQNALACERSKFNGKRNDKTASFEYDHNRVISKAWLQSLIIPTLVGLTGVVLYGFASRYQFKMLPR